MLPTAKSTKIPPCGARTSTSSAIERPPVTALPSMIDGITRSGSAAANGIAPSVMNDAPSSQPALPFSRSAGGEQLRADHGGQGQRERRHHAGEHHRGHDLQLRGVAAVAAAAARPAVAKHVGHLVQRAAHVEGHHQAEHRRRAGSRWPPLFMLFRPSLSWSISLPSGLPSTMIMIDAGDDRGQQRDHQRPASGRAPRPAPSSWRSSGRSRRRARRR